ncbi:glutathione S-transferase family protein [Pseudomonas sp. PS1]|uniref:Glutathione S-transferase family protein n=1 Tax=Stutzerimonas marianensis TaxID=2929513 RepID=A0A9X1W0W1_9GAMM|nr:glutathione S-transferase family protein [Pseudomonas marianensis]MCJ0972475.1 glutathione S-transferase family protein [Pseudomonas marianensis]
MSMILYGAPLSPFVRKVRLCLQEKGLDYQLEVVMPFTPPEWYLQLNPLGRIPAFKDGDLTLADSSVICQYLEEAYPDTAHLYGSDPAQRAKVRWLEKYADYELAPLTTFTVFRNRILKPSSGHPCNEDAVQAALTEKLPPHFDYLEAQLGDRPYFLGDQLSLADLAVASQLLNMEHGGEHLDATRWPSLAAHHDRVRSLASTQSFWSSEQRTTAKLVEMGKARQDAN